MSSRDDIVITGVGVVSPIGIGRQPFWESLLSGTSGVGPITLFDPSALPVRFGGELKGFDPKDYVQPRKAIKLMARELQTAFAAASLATKDAGLEVASLDHDRLGVLYGSEMLFGDPNELAQIYQQSIDEGQFHIWNFGGKILTELYPLWMLKYLPNMAACHVGISHDARGPNNTIVQDDASSLLAVCEAVHVMQRGHADVMIVGGVGSRLSLSPLIFRGDTDLSHRHESPQQASRPFDLHRDGMVNGEGAAAFVFERRSHAEARGAKPLCQILGFSRMFGSSSAGTAPPATET
ncbi:MAG: beta-ketoacyl-[acyl-carrier-protein] synthase family protein, partial [Planctomycetales bacterium]|nr:beta-ketoacyl-[acyl-carrier-protein] synthase family protein [Planctomycetales bacterium]